MSREMIGEVTKGRWEGLGCPNELSARSSIVARRGQGQAGGERGAESVRLGSVPEPKLALAHAPDQRWRGVMTAFLDPGG